MVILITGDIYSSIGINFSKMSKLKGKKTRAILKRRKGDGTIFRDFLYQIMLKYRLQGTRLTQRQLAKALGTTEQNFYNKMQKNYFTVADMLKITDYLGMEVVIRDKDGEEYQIKKGE